MRGVTYTSCYALISKRQFYKYRKICKSQKSTASPIKTSALKHHNNSDSFKHYQTTIMSRFRNDDTGEMCRQNEYLVTFGFHKYLSANTNIAKRDEKKKSIMASMRQIAKLFKEFSTLLAHTSKLEDLTIKDMFKRKHFAVIKGIISDRARRAKQN